MKESIEVRQERAKLVEAVQEINRNSAAEGRSLTPAELAALDALDTQIRACGSRIEVAEKREAGEKAEFERKLGINPQVPRETQVAVDHSISGGGHYILPSQSFRSALPHNRGDWEPSPESLAKIVKGLVLSDWRGAAEEKRQLAESPGSAGGYLLPLQVSGQIVDFARDASVCVAAGARTVAIPGGSTFRWPVLASDPSNAEWKAENATISNEGAVTFGARDFAPHTLMCVLTGSIELLEDSVMLEDFLRTTLTRSLSQKLDLAGLSGGGSAEPEGILSNSNINTQSASSSTITYGVISQAVEACATDNHIATSLIVNPRDYFILDRLESSGAGADGQPLRPFPSYEALRKFTTNALAVDASGVTDAIVGNFNELVFGVRTDFRLELSRLDSDSLKNLQFRLRCYGRFDVQLLRPEAFCSITDLTAS